MKLAIVILNYRTADLTIQCLESLAPQMTGARVVLVDNASGDGSVEKLRAAIAQRGWPWITLIESQKNLGFAGGNNLGLKAIGDAKYVLLLNSDTIVSAGTLDFAMGVMARDLDVGVMSCLLRSADGSVQNTARRAATPMRLAAYSLGLPWAWPSLFSWANLEDPGWDRTTTVRDVDWVGGAFMLIRREVIDEFGGLDDSFFFYGEDAEFCHRVRQAGWRVRYDPGAEIVHLGGASSAGTARNVLWWKARYHLQRQCYGAAAEQMARLVDLLSFGSRYWKLRLTGKRGTPQFAEQEKILEILQGKQEKKKKSTGLRIAIALPGLHRVNRGAETAMEEIARQLAKSGHHVTVFGSGQPKSGTEYHFVHVPCVLRERLENWPTGPGVRSHYAWEELSFSAGLMRKFRPGEFDVTMACSYPWTSWVLRRSKARHIFITQNGDWMARAKNAEYRYFDCDGLVCTNPDYFDRHKNSYAMTALIPNGVNPEKFLPGPADRQAYGLPHGVKICLMVSALIPSKRVVEGVRAVAEVPDLFLVVAGDGECRQEVDGEAEKLLPGRYKRLVLPREKMPGLYRCADVMLHMSQDEPSANAYLEALATGLPIVTHDWEVTRWTLENAAILVDTNKGDMVAEGLKTALQNGATGARELAKRRFDWNELGKQYSAFCRRVVEMSEQAAQGDSLQDVGIVAIGRNEGDRLKKCLASVCGRAMVVYVDSGSTDASVAAATEAGAAVVELDPLFPFCAARARNAGMQQLLKMAPNINYVQFIDGDCMVRQDWLQLARAELEKEARLGVVCGRRRERFPNASIYNRLIDMEWDTRIGPAKQVGGDAMYRVSAFQQVGGFDPSVVAGEEPELCLRLRHAGWKILRIGAEMTLHDAAIKRFAPWWKRNVRGGYAAMDVHSRFSIGGERIYGKLMRSAWVWGVAWPVMTVAALCVNPWAAGIVFLLLPVQTARVALGALRRGRTPKMSVIYAVTNTISKWAWLMGELKLWRDRRSGHGAKLVEYKTAGQ